MCVVGRQVGTRGRIGRPMHHSVQGVVVEWRIRIREATAARRTRLGPLNRRQLYRRVDFGKVLSHGRREFGGIGGPPNQKRVQLVARRIGVRERTRLVAVDEHAPGSAHRRRQAEETVEGERQVDERRKREMRRKWTDRSSCEGGR